MKLEFPVLLLLAASFSASAAAADMSYTRPPDLDAIENSSIFSIYQDSLGAIWLNTNYGICRYNGVSLDILSDPLPMRNISGNGKDLFYAVGYGSILKFNVCSDGWETLPAGDIDLERASMFAEGDSLYVCDGRRVNVMGRGPGIRLHSMLPQDAGDISVICRGVSGHLLAGTTRGGLYEFGQDMSWSKVFDPEDAVCALYTDSRKNIWIGLREKGFMKLDAGYRLLKASGPSGKGQMRNCRTFCEDASGRIYVGTLDGLYIVGTDSSVHQDEQYSPGGHSICSLLRDRDGNIWIGTFYSGMYLCEADITPFSAIEQPWDNSIRLVNAMVADKRGDIWIVTDHYGVFRKRPGQVPELVPETRSRKFKAAWYDEAEDAIWLGDHLGTLSVLSLKDRTWSSYGFLPEQDKIIGIHEILFLGGEFYLGTTDGVYIFDKDKEKIISRKISGYDNLVFSLVMDKSGTLWIGGYGLFSTRDFRTAVKSDGFGDIGCAELYIDNEDRLWIASIGHGVISVESGDRKRTFNSGNSGLADNHTYLLYELKKGMMLVGTRSGVSILDIPGSRCFNYNPNNGLGMSSAREGSLLRLPDGTILIGGTDGIVSFTPPLSGMGFISGRTPEVKIDKMFVNNRRYSDSGKAVNFDGHLVLCHEQNSISFEITSFDYNKVVPAVYEYRLGGLSQEWQDVASDGKIAFTSLRPGQYTLEVRATRDFSGKEYETASVSFRIRPPWYASPAAVAAYILAASAIIFWILSTIYSKMLLKQQLKAEEKDNNDRMRFFINLSHELRTPLTIIIGQLELFLKRHATDGADTGSVRSSWRNALKMQEIVSDLLDFEKQSRGYSTLGVCATDMGQFLQGIMDSFSGYAECRDISLRLSCPEEPVKVWIDRGQMRKLMSNLLINAFKFTPGGGTVSIVLGAPKRTGKDACAMIMVSDTGCGISQEALPKLFNPFYQDPANRAKTIGTGIGLALCRGIAELHHGTLTAGNNPSGGAVFTLSLPMGDNWFSSDMNVRAVEEDGLPPEPVHGYAPVLADDGIHRKDSNGYRLLIVEDDADMMAMLQAIFSPEYSIIKASDGKKGLDAARSAQPDIIISDVQMPAMDGIELCRKLKEDFATCHIPVILLTAYASEENRLSGLGAWADDFVSKPFSIELLRAKCRNLLRNREKIRSKFSRSIYDSAGIAANRKDADFLENVISVIDSLLPEQEINVSILSSRMHVSRTLLAKKIKGLTGSTPHEFIENTRMKYAARLLLDGRHNISEVSYEMGFSSPKYFTIRFRKIFGTTPTDFLKAHQQPQGQDS